MMLTVGADWKLLSWKHWSDVNELCVWCVTAVKESVV